MINQLFLFWAIFNLFIGFWEIYAFTNRDKLLLSSESIWDKIKNGSTTFNTFWIDAWSEYCKVDSRYIKTYSPLQYVWGFELFNSILAILFLYFLISKNMSYLKIILLLSIFNCSFYYLTLIYEIYNNNTIFENVKQYASVWNLIIYYLICSIWLIIPIILCISYELVITNS